MANLQKKSFWQQYGNLILILSGILIGALIGVVAPNFGTTIKPIGDIFLNLLFTIVVPLVFVSIASAVGGMANMKRLGKILGGTIGTFIFTGAIAGVCVLVWVNLFSPSAGTTIELVASEVGEAQTAGELLVSSLTVSDFSDLWDKSNMLPLIIFAILFGFCVSACGGEQSPMGRLLANLNDIIMKFVGIIMLVAPIGLGAYFANLVATYGPEIIGDYGRSMLVYYPLCALYGVIFFPLYAFLAGGRRGVAAMVKKGLLALCPGKGAHSGKIVTLTAEGCALAERTVVPVIAAEEKAIRAFGLASAEEMHRLAQRHLECLQREFETISAFP